MKQKMRPGQPGTDRQTMRPKDRPTDNETVTAGYRPTNDETGTAVDRPMDNESVTAGDSLAENTRKHECRYDVVPLTKHKIDFVEIFFKEIHTRKTRQNDRGTWRVEGTLT